MDHSEQDKSTTQLLADAKLGDDFAKNRVAAKVRPIARKIAAQMLNGGNVRGTDASDIAQAVVAAVMQRIEGFRGTKRSQLYAYAREVVRTEVLREIRQARPDLYQKLEQEAPDPNIGDVTPSQVVAGREKDVIVKKAVDLLPREDRRLVQLRFVEGLPWSNVAKQLNCSQDAVRQRGHRALERLERILKKLGWRK